MHSPTRQRSTLEAQLSVPWNQKPSDFIGRPMQMTQHGVYTYRKWPWGRKTVKIYAERGAHDLEVVGRPT